MSETPCQRCTRPVSDAHVCSTCGRDAEKALGNLPALAVELDTTIARQARFSAGNDGSRSAETPMPFHIRAGEARDVLRNILVGWCKLYAEECRADLPADTLVAMSAFLLKRVEWFRHHDLAATFVDEIVTAIGAVARVIDAPANRTTFTVGPCPEVDAIATPCPGEVRAYIPASESDLARLECSACGTQWGTWQWLRAGKRILERMTERMTA